MSSMFL